MCMVLVLETSAIMEADSHLQKMKIGVVEGGGTPTRRPMRFCVRRARLSMPSISRAIPTGYQELTRLQAYLLQDASAQGCRPTCFKTRHKPSPVIYMVGGGGSPVIYMVPEGGGDH